MRNFQDSFETRKQPFISAFSICMTVLLKERKREYIGWAWEQIKQKYQE